MDSSRAFTFTPALSIVVQCETEQELDPLYASLSDGGTVLMPLEVYPFGARSRTASASRGRLSLAEAVSNARDA